MSIKGIIQWQWEGYAKFHKSRSNLWLHIFAVPIFIAGSVLLFSTVFNFSVLLLVVSILLMAVSLAVQGIGHNEEALPPEPFTGPVNAVIRILLEQLYTFPKFVISGGWCTAYRNSKSSNKLSV
ncbi:terminase [Pseudoalteromonas rubra]|uniref:terminase n=1 Tax=Pseudoalteromonas rubra TaxID=43658 RepID=UPI000F7856F1|nr:terminase [Pseudoalteromonas rubra]